MTTLEFASRMSIDFANWLIDNDYEPYAVDTWFDRRKHDTPAIYPTATLFEKFKKEKGIA